MLHDQSRGTERRFWQLCCGWLRQGSRRGDGAEGREVGRQGGREAVLARSSQRTLALIPAWRGWAWTGAASAHIERKGKLAALLPGRGGGQRRPRTQQSQRQWGAGLRASGAAGARSREKLKLESLLPNPPFLLAFWLPGCAEEQICGVEGFQASHLSCTVNILTRRSSHARRPHPLQESSGGGPGAAQGDLPDSPLNFALFLALVPVFF